ncbi:MAG: DASH family cryptochrome, partial [Flavobacteriaceae bacterium]|nr:DASH family cryptochrome [Flavobacteriaceae bacterium]
NEAIQNNDRVIGVFCLDPRWRDTDSFGFKKMEKFRANFLLETLQELKTNLEELNISLLILSDTPEEIIPKLITEHHIEHVYFQKEWTAEEAQVEQSVRKQSNTTDVKWHSTYDQFLFHPDDIPFEFAEVPKVFTVFRKKCEKYSKVRPRVTPSKLSEENLLQPTNEIPTLQQLGYEDFETDPRSAFPFTGGENSARKRLNYYFWETKKLSYYKKTRNGLIGKDFSSKFSPWLANGSISARTIFWEIEEYESAVRKNDSTYWLFFELVWRDFFKYISLKHGNQIFKIAGILQKDYKWKSNADLIEKWIHGNTAEPFVNANMIELKETGWMSNRGRQNVASFLAKELNVDWRIGAAYFESMLIDYDVHSNYGNWMYVAGVGNDPRDRKFNIQSQADRYDPKSKYQNLWLQPVLF